MWTWCFVKKKKEWKKNWFTYNLSWFFFFPLYFRTIYFLIFLLKNFYAFRGKILLLVVLPKENNTKSYTFKTFYFRLFRFLHTSIHPSTICIQHHVLHVVTKFRFNSNALWIVVELWQVVYKIMYMLAYTYTNIVRSCVE